MQFRILKLNEVQSGPRSVVGIKERWTLFTIYYESGCRVSDCHVIDSGCQVFGYQELECKQVLFFESFWPIQIWKCAMKTKNIRNISITKSLNTVFYRSLKLPSGVVKKNKNNKCLNNNLILSLRC